MIKKTFDRILALLNESVSRFKTSTIYISLLTILLSTVIIFEPKEDIYLEMAVALVACFVCSVFCCLVTERFSFKGSKLLNIILPLVFGAINFVVIDYSLDSVYIIMALVTSWILLVVLAVAILYDYKSNKEMFLHLFKSFIYCYVVTNVIFAGLAVSIGAFNSLIFRIKDAYKIYLVLAVITEVTMPLLMFLSFIPQKDEEITINKTVSKVVNKIGLALYVLLIAILLMYLAKIIVTRDMPVGVINWYASFALLFYVFFYLSTQCEEDSVTETYRKYSGFALLAIYAIQAIAIYIRVNDFGLTTARYLSILMNTIALAFIVGSIFKVETKHLFLVSAVIVLLAGVGPLNIIDVPARNQLSRLNKVLKANGMLVDGKIVANGNVSIEDQKKIYSAIDYLAFDDSKVASEQIKKAGRDENYFKSVFGFESPGNYHYIYEDTIYVYYYNNNIFEFDISKYSAIKALTSDYDSELADFMYQFYLKNGENYQGLIEYKHSNGSTYVITNTDFEIKGNRITWIHYEGYQLIP